MRGMVKKWTDNDHDPYNTLKFCQANYFEKHSEFIILNIVLNII